MAILILMSALVLAGAGMLFVGIRGLVTGRATIYSGKWLLALIALCFLPQLLNTFKLLPAFSPAALLNLLMYLFLLLVFWIVTKGYICFGVSDEMANAALKSVLEKLGLKHEQSLGSIRLENGGIFQIAVQDWVGTMQIKAKNRQAGAQLPGLISALSDYFAAFTGKIKSMPYWIYTICGAILLTALALLLNIAARQS